LLSLEAPSRLSVGLCLHHGVCPKRQWLVGLGLPEGCWPGFGLIRTLYTDNAREFRARSLRRAAQIYAINLEFRPPADPAAGGIIERAIGTFMGKLRLLPGASYSKTLGKKPRHADRQARFTLKELEQYLARQISVYHKSIHSTLGIPPLTAWERGWVINGTPCMPALPENAERFLLSFLPGELRTVSREGVALFGLRYQSPELSSLIGGNAKHMIRFDPRDLSRIFVETASHYVPVTLTRHPGVPFSLWEWRELRAHRHRSGAVREPEQIADELRANRALIHAKSASRAVRRQARESLWRQTQVPPPTFSSVLQSAPLEQAPHCRVEE
jgi:putative transposase